MRKKIAVSATALTLIIASMTGCGNNSGIGINELTPVSDESSVLISQPEEEQEETEEVWYEDDNLTMDEIILKDTLQSKYDELVVKYRDWGRNMTDCEGVKVTDEFVKELTKEEILTYEDFWSKVVDSVDSSGAVYAGSDIEKYEAAYITAIRYTGFYEISQGKFVDFAAVEADE